jgi:riboflavin kinase/FMN adenylyltransferase
MKVINGFENLPSFSQQTVVALGNFDGVHLGHRRILEFVTREATRLDLVSMVLTFSPHPEKILGKRRIKMIQTLEQRLEEIKTFGIQAVLVIPFDRKFSNLTPREFVKEIIIDLLRAEAVVVGDEFRFGRNRQGDIALFQKITSKFDIQVFSLSSVAKNGRKVSSSLIRKFLQEGRMEAANSLLGRPYAIDGRVIKGKSQGKVIGFPTANIQTDNEITPPGVFITKVKYGSEDHPSLTNIGECPTFEKKEKNIESYIIDFDRNLYRRKIRIYFFKKIREEMKFSTPQDLSRQIKRDIEAAKAYFHLA